MCALLGHSLGAYGLCPTVCLLPEHSVSSSKAGRGATSPQHSSISGGLLWSNQKNSSFFHLFVLFVLLFTSTSLISHICIPGDGPWAHLTSISPPCLRGHASGVHQLAFVFCYELIHPFSVVPASKFLSVRRWSLEVLL